MYLPSRTLRRVLFGHFQSKGLGNSLHNSLLMGLQNKALGMLKHKALARCIQRNWLDILIRIFCYCFHPTFQLSISLHKILSHYRRMKFPHRSSFRRTFGYCSDDKGLEPGTPSHKSVLSFKRNTMAYRQQHTCFTFNLRKEVESMDTCLHIDLCSSHQKFRPNMKPRKVVSNFKRRCLFGNYLHTFLCCSHRTYLNLPDKYSRIWMS